MESKELLEEIKLTFRSLDIKLSTAEFVSRCRTIEYRPSVALDAIKEFSIRLEVTGQRLRLFWNEFMIGTERMINTLSEWGVLSDEVLLDYLKKDLLWLVGKRVLEDDDPLDLIKLRL